MTKQATGNRREATDKMSLTVIAKGEALRQSLRCSSDYEIATSFGGRTRDDTRTKS